MFRIKSYLLIAFLCLLIFTFGALSISKTQNFNDLYPIDKEIPIYISESSYSIYENILKKSELENWNLLPFNELYIKVAMEFLNTPYIGGTLDTGGDEQCRLILEGLDCVTFYENALAIARCIKKETLTMDDVIAELTFLRYRHGILSGYTSRLHYSSDWVYDNILKETVIDRTKDLGGVKSEKTINFMSQNPNYYEYLKKHPYKVAQIAQIEKEISKRGFYYIPKDKIKDIESKIASGDIILFVTNIKGLDYSHTGLAYVDENNTALLLHASTTYKEVVLDKSITGYVKSAKNILGISIISPIEP